MYVAQVHASVFMFTGRQNTVSGVLPAFPLFILLLKIYKQ